jgi:serine/threonine protein phosphatase PrpC
MAKAISTYAPGESIAEKYVVEGLVRLGEGRAYYIVTDDHPTGHECHSCGDRRPAEERVCEACGGRFFGGRYLMSKRWSGEHYDSYEQFVNREITHDALVHVIDVERVEDGLLSFTRFGTERLLLDEASPMSGVQCIEIMSRLIGACAHLLSNGIEVARFSAANVMISNLGDASLFDFSVMSVDAVSERAKVVVVDSIARAVRPYCALDASVITTLLDEATDGMYDDLEALGRALEKRIDQIISEDRPSQSSGMTDVGLVRQLNEDTWGWRRLSHRAKLFMVADGMGGHDGGEVASKMAVDTMSERAFSLEADAPQGQTAITAMIDTAFQAANNAIKDDALSKGTDMGTTLTAMVQFDDKSAYFANVGDSRAYLFRQSALSQVSKDHSLVEQMVERGRISRIEARTHPHSNILLRTVGTEHDVEIDVFRVQLVTGDRVMLCSDGLWGEVEEVELATILNTYDDPRVVTRELVRAAHTGGGKDNVTVVIVDVT